MKAHNLMQAIARVNRVYPGKTGGLIVDYIGLKTKLNGSFKRHIQNVTKIKYKKMNKHEFSHLNTLEVLRNMFHTFPL